MSVSLPRVSARTSFLTLDIVAGLASSMAFAVTSLFRIRLAGLSPRELVLVGTVMELAVLVFEVPTGVVADAISRRASIIIGHLGMGAALLAESQMRSFWPILLCQACWGASYTFTSGATEAWLAGEVGDEQYGDLSLLASQIGAPLRILGLVTGYGLAAAGLWVPLLIGGTTSLLLGIVLVFTMPERAYRPTATADRSTWQNLAATARAGVGHVRRRRILVMLALSLAVAGGSTEAFDRLWEFHLLNSVGLPSVMDGSPVFWFGALSSGTAILGFFATRHVRRAGITRDRARMQRWIGRLVVVESASVLVFALAPVFGLGAAAFLSYDRARRLRSRLLGAWILPLTPEPVRATVLSTIGQADALGQVLVGPGLGLVAQGSTTAALGLSAALLLPVLLPLRAAGRSGATPL